MQKVLLSLTIGLILILTGLLLFTISQKVQSEENQVTVYGRLTAPTEISEWRLVDNRQGYQDYILINIEEFKNSSWIKEGEWAQITGVLKPETTKCPQLGAALKVQSIVPINPLLIPEDKIEVIGKLQKTVEAGGWVISNTDTGKIYLLLNINQCKNQSWFKEGAWVKVDGTVKKDVATIYMQGIPMQVDKIHPVICKAK